MKTLQGNIVVSVYTDEKGFVNNMPFYTQVFPKDQHIKNGVFSCIVSLPEGNYGIAVHDDENGDKKMNYNFLGQPKEGYGFLNFYHKNLRRPSYYDFEFFLNKRTSRAKVKLRYL